LLAVREPIMTCCSILTSLVAMALPTMPLPRTAIFMIHQLHRAPCNSSCPHYAAVHQCDSSERNRPRPERVELRARPPSRTAMLASLGHFGEEGLPSSLEFLL